MDRETAVALCREKCLKETTVRHLISVEGVMRALARRFGEDEDLWGLTGMRTAPSVPARKITPSARVARRDSEDAVHSRATKLTIPSVALPLLRFAN